MSICQSVLLTPWFPLKQMVGCEDQPWRKRNISEFNLVMVSPINKHTHTRTLIDENRWALKYRKQITQRMFCGLHRSHESDIFHHCGFITAILPLYKLLFFMSLHGEHYITFNAVLKFNSSRTLQCITLIYLYTSLGRAYLFDKLPQVM